MLDISNDLNVRAYQPKPPEGVLEIELHLFCKEKWHPLYVEDIN